MTLIAAIRDYGKTKLCCFFWQDTNLELVVSQYNVNSVFPLRPFSYWRLRIPSVTEGSHKVPPIVSNNTIFEEESKPLRKGKCKYVLFVMLMVLFLEPSCSIHRHRCTKLIKRVICFECKQFCLAAYKSFIVFVFLIFLISSYTMYEHRSICSNTSYWENEWSCKCGYEYNPILRGLHDSLLSGTLYCWG